MSDHLAAPTEPGEGSVQEQAQQSEEPSLAEIAARRVAARSQWQKALARAKERFDPVNMREEVIDTASDKIGTAADKAGAVAWAHRGKLAIAGLLGSLFFARKPIAKVTTPLAEQARTTFGKARQGLRDRKKR